MEVVQKYFIHFSIKQDKQWKVKSILVKNKPKVELLQPK